MEPSNVCDHDRTSYSYFWGCTPHSLSCDCSKLRIFPTAFELPVPTWPSQAQSFYRISLNPTFGDKIATSGLAKSVNDTRALPSALTIHDVTTSRYQGLQLFSHPKYLNMDEDKALFILAWKHSRTSQVLNSPYSAALIYLPANQL